jgi:hypothetical protein
MQIADKIVMRPLEALIPYAGDREHLGRGPPRLSAVLSGVGRAVAAGGQDGEDRSSIVSVGVSVHSPARPTPGRASKREALQRFDDWRAARLRKAETRRLWSSRGQFATLTLCRVGDQGLGRVHDDLCRPSASVGSHLLLLDRREVNGPGPSARAVPLAQSPRICLLLVLLRARGAGAGAGIFPSALCAGE